MSNKKDRTEVDFSPPEAPSGYQARIAAAKASHTPIGGVEMPKMPNLSEPPPQNRHVGVEQRNKPMPNEEYHRAVAEGRAIPGVGGAYAANQPAGRRAPAPPTTPMEMTSKDGNPVNPPRPEGGLRPETIAAVTAVTEANKEEKKDEEPLSKEDEEYFTRLGAQTDDILRNKERRELIEKRISDDLNFEELLFQRELRQRVPIRKDFVPTYRTCSGDEDLFVKRLISKEEGSPQYLLDRFSMMTLCCGLFAINGKPLPDHLNDKRNPTEDLFKAKYEVVAKYPLIILADLSANFIWFEQRVQKLLSLDSIRDF